MQSFQSRNGIEAGMTLSEVENAIAEKRNYRVQLLERMKNGNYECNEYNTQPVEFYEGRRKEVVNDGIRMNLAKTHRPSALDFECDPDIVSRISNTREKAKTLISSLKEQIHDSDELVNSKSKQKKRKSKSKTRKSIPREKDSSLRNYVRTYTQADRAQMSHFFAQIDVDDVGVISLQELKHRLQDSETFCQFFGLEMEELDKILACLVTRRPGLIHFDEFVEAINCAMEQANLDSAVSRTLNNTFSTPSMNSHLLNERDIRVFRDIFSELDTRADGIVLALDFLKALSSSKVVDKILDKQIKPNFTLSNLISFFKSSLIKHSSTKQYLTWSGFIDLLWKASKEESNEDVNELLKLNDSYWLIGEQINLPPTHLRLIQDVFDSLQRENEHEEVQAASFVNGCKKDPQVRALGREEAREEGNGLPKESIEDVLNRLYIESEPLITWKDVLMFFSQRGRPMSFLNSHKLIRESRQPIREYSYNSTKPIPFSFTNRPKSHSIREKRVEGMVREKEEEEEREMRTRAKPKSIPKAVLVPRLERLKVEEEERRVKKIEESKQAMLSSIKEFNFVKTKPKTIPVPPPHQPFKAKEVPKSAKAGLYQKIIQETEAQRVERIEKRKEEVKRTVKMPPRMEAAERQRKEKEEKDKEKEKKVKGESKAIKTSSTNTEVKKKKVKEGNGILLDEVKSVKVVEVVSKRKIPELNSAPPMLNQEKEEISKVQTEEKVIEFREEHIKPISIDKRPSQQVPEDVKKELKIEIPNSIEVSNKLSNPLPNQTMKPNQLSSTHNIKKPNPNSNKQEPKPKHTKIKPQDESLPNSNPNFTLTFHRESTPPKPLTQTEKENNRKVKEYQRNSKEAELAYKEKVEQMNAKVRETKNLFMEERFGSKMLKKYREMLPKEEGNQYFNKDGFELHSPGKKDNRMRSPRKQILTTKLPFIKSQGNSNSRISTKKSGVGTISESNTLSFPDCQWKEMTEFFNGNIFLESFQLSTLKFPVKNQKFTKLSTIYSCLASTPDLLLNFFSGGGDREVFKYFSNGVSSFGFLNSQIAFASDEPLFVTSTNNDWWPTQLHKALIQICGDFEFDCKVEFDLEFIFEAVLGAPTKYMAIEEGIDEDKFYNEMLECLEQGFFVIFSRFYKGTASWFRLADVYQVKGDLIFKVEDPCRQFKISNGKYSNQREWSPELMSIASPTPNELCTYLSIDEVKLFVGQVLIIEFVRNYVNSVVELQTVVHQSNFLVFSTKADQNVCIRLFQTIGDIYYPIDIQLFKSNDVDPWLLVTTGSNRKFKGSHIINASPNSSFLKLPAGEYIIRLKTYDPITYSDVKPNLALSVYTGESVSFSEFPKPIAKSKYAEFLILRAKKNLKNVDRGLYMGYEEFDSRYIIYLENRLMNKILAAFTLENMKNVKIGKENRHSSNTITMSLKKETGFAVVKQINRSSNTGFQMKTNYKIEK